MVFFGRRMHEFTGSSARVPGMVSIFGLAGMNRIAFADTESL